MQGTNKLMSHPFYVIKKSQQSQVYFSSMADSVCAAETEIRVPWDGDGLRKFLTAKTGGLYWKGL